MPIYIQFPTEQTPTKLADWLEINTLADPDGNTSAQDLKYPLSSESEGENSIDDSEIEEVASQVFNEIQKRIVATGKGYPFKFEGDKLVRKSTRFKYLPYIFCLLISYFGVEKSEYSTKWKKNTIGKKFENLSARAIKQLLHNGKCHLTICEFGWPRQWNGVETNPHFLRALEKLCRDIGEMKPQGIPLAGSMKDAGLDIVAWKKFPDKLSGSVIFWGQCASGDNWEDKFFEIEKFKFFVVPPSQVLKGTFIPHIVEIPISKPFHWDFLTSQAGMLFDRCRVSYLAEEWEDELISEIVRDSLTKIRNENANLLQL